MRIIVDIMGGDNAPYEILKGVFEYSRQQSDDIVLVGARDIVISFAKQNGIDPWRFDIVDTLSTVTMEDDPLAVLQTKKDSSMMMGLRLLADGKGDAFVSAGNTGALFAGATFIVKRVGGVKRAAIGTFLPAQVPFLLLDAGANVTVNSEQLLQFAVMGSAYMKKMYGIENPKVGLLNNGTEEHKGTSLQQEANRVLSQCKYINYVGNVEGNSSLFGACNVLVTDGFTGNIFLKAMEGIGKLMLVSVKQVFMKNLRTKLSAALVKKPFSDLKSRFDPTTYGGSPLIGISKPVVKAHGSSNAAAIENAMYEAVRYAKSGVIGEIASAAQTFGAGK